MICRGDHQVSYYLGQQNWLRLGSEWEWWCDSMWTCKLLPAGNGVSYTGFRPSFLFIASKTFHWHLVSYAQVVLEKLHFGITVFLLDLDMQRCFLVCQQSCIARKIVFSYFTCMLTLTWQLDKDRIVDIVILIYMWPIHLHWFSFKPAVRLFMWGACAASMPMRLILIVKHGIIDCIVFYAASAVQ